MSRAKYYAGGSWDNYADMALVPAALQRTVTLAANGWSLNTQTVTVNGVTADNLIMVSPDPADYAAYGESNIRATAQAAGSVTFVCDTTPNADIDVAVAILGTGGLPSGTADGDTLLWNVASSSWFAGRPSRLPAGYQEVEYIESDGTGQYIDTGIPCDEIYEICADIKFNAIQEADIGVFSSTGTAYKGYSIGIDVNNKFRAQLPNYGMAVVFENASTNRFKFYISEILGSYWTESAFATINKHAPFTSANFYLFARYNADTTPPAVQRYCNMRLYHIAFKGKDNLISHDFIPCYRIADNEIGIYDLVSKTFFTNDGTGAFTKGADV